MVGGMGIKAALKSFRLRDWLVIFVGGTIFSEFIKWFVREVLKDLFFGAMSDFLRSWLAKMTDPVVAQFIASSLLPYLIGFGAVIFVAWWFGQDRKRRALTVSPRIESPNKKQARVYIDVVNESEGTIRGVVACIDSITNGSNSETERMISQFLEIDGVQVHNDPSECRADLHPGQSVSYNIGSVNAKPGNVVFNLERRIRQVSGDGRSVIYHPMAPRSVKAGRWRVSIVVRGEDVRPEIVSFEFISTKTKVKVEIL